MKSVEELMELVPEVELKPAVKKRALRICEKYNLTLSELGEATYFEFDLAWNKEGSLSFGDTEELYREHYTQIWNRVPASYMTDFARDAVYYRKQQNRKHRW